MAKAKKNVIKVPVTTYVDEEAVTLDLTITEARVLASLLGSIGGDRRNSWRGQTQDILDALEVAGVSHSAVTLDVDSASTYKRHGDIKGFAIYAKGMVENV